MRKKPKSESERNRRDSNSRSSTIVRRLKKGTLRETGKRKTGFREISKSKEVAWSFKQLRRDKAINRWSKWRREKEIQLRIGLEWSMKAAKELKRKYGCLENSS